MKTVLHLLSDTGYGGVQECCLAICKYSKNYKHHVLRCKAGAMEEEFRATGINITECRQGFETELHNVLSVYSIDLIHAHNPGGSWPQYMDMAVAAKPTIENIHCVRTGTKQEEKLLHRIVGSTYNFNLQGNKKNLSIIPYPVSLWRYEEVFSNTIGVNKTLVGRLGNITGLKLPLHFIEVVNMLVREGMSNVDFRLMGGDDHNKGHLQDCKDRMERLGIQKYLHITGNVNGNKFGALLELAVFLYPTSRESYGIVFIEAMLCGLPVVTYDNCANKETVGVGGVAVPHNDINALAAATKRFVQDVDLRKRVGEAGKNLVLERNHPVKVITQYEEIYRKVVGN